ncbi:MAG: membrane protein insertion efficiency factor YidD [Actinomycetota bacterium]|nr:membrane protein insertion efficiency factor YidD [Actinomycetota bacterium]
MTDPRLAPGVAVRSLSVPIRLYQAARGGRPSPCRYWPTCSAYALEALETHGAVRGSWLAGRRLLRCHPWAGRSGVDPVPSARGAS